MPQWAFWLNLSNFHLLLLNFCICRNKIISKKMEETHVPRTSFMMYLSSTVGTFAFFLSEDSFGVEDVLDGFFFPKSGIFVNRLCSMRQKTKTKNSQRELKKDLECLFVFNLMSSSHDIMLMNNTEITSDILLIVENDTQG